jgi:tetratricopeptide (TPR) repeat protein
MISELARYEEFWSRKSVMNSTNDYRKDMETFAKDQIKSIDNLQQSIDMQTVAIVASQAALANTFNQGFGRIDNSLTKGFSDVTNQLGSMTASISTFFLNHEKSMNRIGTQICGKLDAIYDAVSNPVQTGARNYYNNAVQNYKGGIFDDALENLKKALDIYKSDYLSWFLLGKVYTFGVSKYANVIDLDRAIDAFQNAEKYINQYKQESQDAKHMAAEIFFHMGFAQFAKSNDLLRENKKAESDEMLVAAKSWFEYSYRYSSNMLEALFYAAKCKNLLGKTDDAMRDLTTLVLKDRNYCIKFYANPDFENLKNSFDAFINSLKEPLFAKAKENYHRLNNQIETLQSLGGNTKIIMLSAPAEDLPYFDMFDYNEELKQDFPIVEKEIEERQAVIKLQEQKAAAEEKARADAEAVQKRWEAGAPAREKAAKKAEIRYKIATAADVTIFVICHIIFPLALGAFFVYLDILDQSNHPAYWEVGVYIPATILPCLFGMALGFGLGWLVKWIIGLIR